MAEERKTVDAVLNEQKEQKSAKKNGAATQKGKNASVESPKADKETEQEPSDQPQPPEGSEQETQEENEKQSKKLEKGTIVALSVLLGMKYVFGRIKINRDIDSAQVRKKIDSIVACGGIISPFLVVPALICLDNNLELEDFDGHTITKDTPNLSFILVIIDGQHRFEALKQLNKKRVREGKEQYEGYCHLPLIDNCAVTTLLREANSATTPWDGMDWLTQLLVTAQKGGIPTQKLKWVKDKAKTGSDSAAWTWLYGKTVSKATSIKASKDPKKLEDLADITSFEEDKKLYEAAAKTFTQSTAKVLGWKVLPEWIHKKLDSLVKRDIVRSKAIAQLVKFLEGMESKDVQEISEMKKSLDQSKDNKIIAKLDELFANFKD